MATEINENTDAYSFVMRAKMMNLLKVARSYSISPLSKYQVGAVCEGESGSLYLGANLEIQGVSILYSFHAEQAAINNAWMHGETSIKSLATSSPPCGFCRQFLYELPNASEIIVTLPEVQEQQRLKELLPHAFGPGALGLEGGLLRPLHHEIPFEGDDPVIVKAVEAAQNSYAPYSSSYSGVSVQLHNGEIYEGRYAETAAFNPSIMPIISALSNLQMLKIPFMEINRCVLVEMEDAFFSQEQLTRDLLGVSSGAVVEVHRIKGKV